MSPERVALIRAVALLAQAQAALQSQETKDEQTLYVLDNIEAFLMGPAPKLAKGETIDNA